MLDSENVVFFSVRLSDSLHWVQMNLPERQFREMTCLPVDIPFGTPGNGLSSQY